MIDLATLVNLKRKPTVAVEAPELELGVLIDRARAAEAEACRASLAQFVRSSWEVLEPNVELEWDAVHDVICEGTQRLIEDVIQATRSKHRYEKDLILNVPPGSLKTRIVSVCALPWAWLRAPWLRALVTSVNPRLPVKTSTWTLQLLASKFYQSLSPDFTVTSEAVTWIRNTANGERRAQSLAAAVIGDRFDLILNDDPDDPEAMGGDALTSAHEAYETIHGRVNDWNSSGRITIQQRVGANDWTAKFYHHDDWSLITVPLIATEKAIDQNARCAPAWFCEWRKPGDVLSPSRFPPEKLAQIKRVAADRYDTWWQQDVDTERGDMFPRGWWRFFHPTARTPLPRPTGCDAAPPKTMPVFDWVAISVDATFKALETSDRVAIHVYGAEGVMRYLLHAEARRLTFLETLARIKELHDRYKPQHVWLEDKANGSAILDVLKASIRGIEGINPEGGKVVRARAAQPIAQAGQVFLLDGAAWLEDFVSEMASFPRGKHDDHVDAYSQAVIRGDGDASLARFLALAGVKPA